MRYFSSALPYPRQVSAVLQEAYWVAIARRLPDIGFSDLSLCPQSQAPALKRCVIVALHLGNNAMGDKGITALAEGLRHARGLQKLHLNDNEASSQLPGFRSRLRHFF